jgi:hypothetical protein
MALSYRLGSVATGSQGQRHGSEQRPEQNHAGSGVGSDRVKRQTSESVGEEQPTEHSHEATEDGSEDDLDDQTFDIGDADPVAGQARGAAG